VEWLAGSGLDLRDGVVTDERGATSLPGVVAVGDCAAASSPALGRPVRTEHWTHALEQPATAVAALLGSDAPVPPAVPYFWSDQYGFASSSRAARREGDEVRVVEGSCADRSFPRRLRARRAARRRARGCTSPGCSRAGAASCGPAVPASA
jgi:NADPH-dependent 2,4-dienoyl-CoA reductase/sulfur reductase-like enzyme